MEFGSDPSGPIIITITNTTLTVPTTANHTFVCDASVTLQPLSTQPVDYLFPCCLIFLQPIFEDFCVPSILKLRKRNLYEHIIIKSIA
jgi:hypothetical protein